MKTVRMHWNSRVKGLGIYRRVMALGGVGVFSLAEVLPAVGFPALPSFPANAASASSGVSNSAGMRGAKEERIDEFRLSRSRASRARVPVPGPVEAWRGELPFSICDGIADTLEGGEPEPMVTEIGSCLSMEREKLNL